MQILLYLTIFLFSWSSPALSNLISDAKDLLNTGVKFNWPEVRSKSLKILLEYQNENGTWQRANLGSGFLISSDGLFVTAYHVMKFCLESQKEKSRFSASVDCSAGPSAIRYKAENGDREFEVQIISHLKEVDSTNGKDIHPRTAIS